MEIITDRLILKEIKSGDLNNIHTLNSLPEVDKFNTSGIPASINDSQLLLTSWITSQTEQPKVRYIFSIIEKQTDDFVGLFGLNMGKPGYKSAEIWYKFHPLHWNKGYAQEAVNIILKFCFTDLQLHRLEAGCAVENKASIKVLEKSGFIKEGQKRKNLPIRGKWSDNYFFALLEEDYFKTLKKRI